MDVWGQFHAPVLTPGETKPVPFDQILLLFLSGVEPLFIFSPCLSPVHNYDYGNMDCDI